MNTYNINDMNFINSSLYQQYINENPKVGFLKIRAYTASGAVPITNLKVTISKIIDNNNVIFFEGLTDSSGVIDKIVLPTPTISTDDLTEPKGATYNVIANYNGTNYNYIVNIYENVLVVQPINIIPRMMGDNNGY